MLAQGDRELVVDAHPGEADAVADRETRGLAGLLHQSHGLAGQTRATQLRCHLQIEGEGVATVDSDGPPLDRGLGDDDVLVRQGDRLARGGGDLGRSAGPEHSHQRGGVRVRNCFGHRLGALAESLAEGSEVGLHAHVDEVGAGDVSEAFEPGDVELLGDLGAQVGREVVPPGRGNEGTSERLTRAHT